MKARTHLRQPLAPDQMPRPTICLAQQLCVHLHSLDDVPHAQHVAAMDMLLPTGRAFRLSRLYPLRPCPRRRDNHLPIPRCSRRSPAAICRRLPTPVMRSRPAASHTSRTRPGCFVLEMTHRSWANLGHLDVPRPATELGREQHQTFHTVPHEHIHQVIYSRIYRFFFPRRPGVVSQMLLVAAFQMLDLVSLLPPYSVTTRHRVGKKSVPRIPPGLAR
jgi:hypothetical protein